MADLSRALNDGRLFSSVRPEATRIRCKGSIVSEGSEVKGTFEVIYLLHRGPLIEVLSARRNAGAPVALSLGELPLSTLMAVTVDGRPVRSSDLHATDTTFPGAPRAFGLVLSPHEDVVIGDTMPEDEVEAVVYPITNYFGSSFELSVDGARVRCEVARDSAELKRWAKHWRMPVESARLAVAGVMTPAVRSRVADYVLHLASFLEGRHLSYGRYTLSGREGKSADVLCSSRRVYNPVFSQELASPVWTGAVLKAILPAFLALAEPKRKQLSLAISCLIDAKAESDVESCTLLLAIAWEILVDMIVAGQELPAVVTELRASLKQAYREWRKLHKTLDPGGLYGDRVAKSLEYNPFLDGIRQVLKEFYLSEEDLGIDMKQFKTARDKIVHEGNARSVCLDITSHVAMNRRVALAADVVILRYLGYQGVVIDRRSLGGWRSDVAMADLTERKHPQSVRE